MKEKKSIVILYSKGLYDTNALEVARTLSESSNDCHVIAIGDDKYTNFWRGKISKSSYIFSMRNGRWMYSLFSKMTSKKRAPNKALKNIKPDPSERTGVNKFVYNMTSRYYKVKNILRRYEPEIVLCYTPTILKSAIKANEQLRMYTTKIYACLTDFCLDMRFFNRRCAGYFVQNEDVKASLESVGIDSNKISVTSMLSDSIKEYPKEEVKREIGIRNDKPCLLLVGGRYGASILKAAMCQLIDYTDNFNLIIMTGGSKTIVDIAKHVADDKADSVFVIESVDDMAKMYSVADVVIATPTTCICTETLSYERPLVLLKGSGAVEVLNARYLFNHNFALDGSSKDKLIDSLSSILLGGDDFVLKRFVKNGTVQGLVNELLCRANDIFEEKKILLAEKEQQEAGESVVDVAEEVEIDREDDRYISYEHEDKQYIKVNDGSNLPIDDVPLHEGKDDIDEDTTDDVKDNDIDHYDFDKDKVEGAIIDEYND